MPEPAIDLSSFLILIVPGAIAVWSFRHFAKSKKEGDFEYLALSAFWGIVVAGLNGRIAKPEKLAELLSNPLAANMVFSLFGFVGGWVVAKVTRITKEDLANVYRGIKEAFNRKSI